MKNSGTHIRQLRKKMGLSQAKLSELTGISQHSLSAFELEKTTLPSTMLDKIVTVLSDEESVSNLANRPKRYRKHEYVDTNSFPDRSSIAKRTIGNPSYLDILNGIFKSHNSSKNKNLSAISLFSGCGGFSLGFSAAGFKIKGFVELQSGLREIYKLNFPKTVEMGSDITQLDQSTAQLYASKFGPIDVIIGGPPCQGFSLTGKRDVDDPRNVLFRHYLRFVDAFRPKFAVLENVRLLTSMKNINGGLVKDDICDEFQKHGYKINYFEINAMHYGVPQHRERVLFVAVRDDINYDPSFPEPTHGDNLEPLRSFGDACSDLPFIESGEISSVSLHASVKHPAHVINWLWDVPQGCSAHENEDPAKRPPSGFNTTYKRQVWNEPGATVQTTSGMISGSRNVHPIATRSLTIREAARLQSFPDQYTFSGSSGVTRTGIGNAVPPLLAYQIAQHIKKML